MLVYVVTNELFDANLAAHFRKLAIDRDKAGEMILVINKMISPTKGHFFHIVLPVMVRVWYNCIKKNSRTFERSVLYVCQQ